MPIFTPPTVDEALATDHPLFRRFHQAQGVTVLKAENGTYSETRYPTAEQVEEAAVAYIGGYTYTVSESEAAALTAAGYGAYIT